MNKEHNNNFYSLESVKELLKSFEDFTDGEEVYYFVGALRYLYDTNKYLQHQLEEKEKIINEAREFLKEFHNYENRFKWCEEDYIKTILKLEEILESGKNEKEN